MEDGELRLAMQESHTIKLNAGCWLDIAKGCQIKIDEMLLALNL